jgi:hypothetical protein
MTGLGFWLLCRELDIIVVVGFPLHFNEFSPDSLECTCLKVEKLRLEQYFCEKEIVRPRNSAS